MLAKTIMTADPACISATAPLSEAVEVLYALDVRHLPVVDEDGVLVGMLSDRDLRTVMGPEDDPVRAYIAAQRTVASVMNSDVLGVDPDAELSEVMGLMLNYKIGAVPVVDPAAEGELLGIISYIDVLRNVSTEEAAE